jgi:hypothetical protein
MPKDKNSIMNTPMGRAYLQASKDDDNNAYADKSGKDDTGVYPEDSPAGGKPSLVDEWRIKIYKDDSWLPDKKGEVIIVPAELFERPGGRSGYKLPDGYRVSPRKTPPFTPEGEKEVPTLGVVIDEPLVPRPKRSGERPPGATYPSTRPGTAPRGRPGPKERGEGTKPKPKLPGSL